MATPDDMNRDDAPLPPSGLGSGLLAQQPTPVSDEAVAISRVCPQCGGEYETGSRFCPRDGSPLRPRSQEGDPLIGRVIADRYLILALLGQGGMGRVYLAEHVKMNRQCAVKVMHPSLVNDADSAARFAREASSAARIIHPNVATLFDYGDADHVVYLVMEFIDGESLSGILSGGALDPRRAIDFARQIADGLAAAHDLGIVHRDLKPDNVIIARPRGGQGRETAKVVDFGIAKALSESPQDSLTKSGLVIGTPEYMSPEQLVGDPVDARADIYSLGCILYQMLTGTPVFAAETREQMVRRRLHSPPPHVRDAIPELPRRLDTLIAHMLARSPGDRLATAAAARDALDPALVLGGWDPSSISAPRVPTGVIPKAGMPNSGGDVALQPTMPLPRQHTSPRRIGIGVVAGSALLFAALFAWSRAHTPVPAAAAPTTNAIVARDTTVQAPATPAITPPAAPSARLAGTATTGTAAPAHGDRARADTAASRSTVDPGIRAALAACATAAGNGDAAALERACPTMSEPQRHFFATLTSSAEQIRATTSVDSARVTGDSATASFVLRLRYVDRNSKMPGQTRLAYTARLARLGSAWILVGLRGRD